MSIEQNLKLLFEDMKASSELIARDRKAYLRQFPFLPPMIPVGDGRMIYVSNNGVRAVAEIAKLIRSNSAELAAAFSEKEMTTVTSSCVGGLIAGDSDVSSNEFAIPTDLNAFRTGLRQRIAERLAEVSVDRTHLFGAWVLEGNSVPSLTIGPVRFLIREMWLQEVIQTGLIDEVRAVRMLEHWQGRTPRERRTGDLADTWVEGVLDAVGPCPWVCLIDVKGHSVERSREKALIAAEIAYAAVILSWQNPSRLAREMGLIFNRGATRKLASVVYKGARFLRSDRDTVLRRGVILDPADAAEFASEAAARLETVGAALDTFLAVRPQSSKTNLERMLCLSLMYFGEACREPLDFMAIVKFGAALDTLAKGKHANGICDLVRNRYPIKDMTAAFLADGTSARKLIEQIYDTGRSQIIHGARPSLIEDFADLHARAQMLTRVTLRACVHWLAGYTGPDDGDAYGLA